MVELHPIYQLRSPQCWWKWLNLWDDMKAHSITKARPLLLPTLYVREMDKRNIFGNIPCKVFQILSLRLPVLTSISATVASIVVWLSKASILSWTSRILSATMMLSISFTLDIILLKAAICLRLLSSTWSCLRKINHQCHVRLLH